MEIRFKTSSEKVETLLELIEKRNRAKFVNGLLERYADSLDGQVVVAAPSVGDMGNVEQFIKQQSKQIVQLQQSVQQLEKSLKDLKEEHLEQQKQILNAIQSIQVSQVVQKVAPVVQPSVVEEAKQETVPFVKQEVPITKEEKKQPVVVPVVEDIEDEDDLFEGLVVEEDENDFAIDPNEFENFKNQF